MNPLLRHRVSGNHRHLQSRTVDTSFGRSECSGTILRQYVDDLTTPVAGALPGVPVRDQSVGLPCTHTHQRTVYRFLDYPLKGPPLRELPGSDKRSTDMLSLLLLGCSFLLVAFGECNPCPSSGLRRRTLKSQGPMVVATQRIPGGRILQGSRHLDQGQDAFTYVEIPEAGEWHLWVRSRDFAATRNPLLLPGGRWCTCGETFRPPW